MQTNTASFAIAATIVMTAGCLNTGPTLVILDQGSFPTFPTLQAAFEDQTGAKVRLIDGTDAGTALRTSLQSAGNPVADVLYGVDNALFFSSGVRKEKLFEPYESPQLSRINQAIVPLNQFRVNGELWATPIDHGYISVNYDVRLADEADLPDSLRDLASPELAPRFVTEDPRESSPGLGFLLATIDTFGETGAYTWKTFWEQLLENGGLVVKDWTTAYVYHFSAGYGSYDPANAGDRDIVVSYTTSPAAEVFFSGGTVAEPPSVSLEPPRGVFHQIETMGILRGTKNRELAEKWIDLVLSDTFQSVVLGDNAVYPVVDGQPVPEPYEDFASAPEDLEPVTLTGTRIRLNLDRWLDEWTAIYQAATA